MDDIIPPSDIQSRGVVMRKNIFVLLLMAVCVLFIISFQSCKAANFLGYLISPDAPLYNGPVKLDGLSAPVEVVFDTHAIPHVKAQRDDDLLYAVGYLHARERLFQMELLRRVSYGRLSELFGNHPDETGSFFRDTLAVDRWMRTAGLGQMGEKLAERMNAHDRRLGDAYVAGINTFIRMGNLPIEFDMLETRPEPWTVGNVMAIVRLNGWGLSLNMQFEMIRLILESEIGEEKTREIFPPFMDHPGPYIIEKSDRDYSKLWRRDENGQVVWLDDDGLASPPSEGGDNAVPAEIKNLPGKQGRLDIQDTEEYGKSATGILASYAAAFDNARYIFNADASNNWVVGPSRSKSDKPILANDPHLMHTVPATFYAMHLSMPGLDVIGVTLPGTPVIVLGHNRNIAWALTTTFADTQDIYLEKIDPENPNRYLTSSGSEEFRVERQDIKEKLEDGSYRTHTLNLRHTRHGVVLNDAVPSLDKKLPILALRTTMDEMSSGDLDAAMRVAWAKDLDEFRSALSSWSAPIQNWVAADDSGNIGYFPAGLIPIREGYDGSKPVPGWKNEYEWKGFIPYGRLPQMWNPPSAKIVTANNKVLPPEDYPYTFALDVMSGYRSARISEMLDEQPKWSAEDLRRMQMDVHCKQADRLMPPLIAALEKAGLQGKEKEAFDILKSWNREADIESVGASLFHASYREMWELSLKDDLSDDLYKLLNTVQLEYGFFDRIWDQYPSAAIFDRKDTPEKEGRDELLPLAFRQALAKLSANYGDDIKGWKWGSVHVMAFQHPFGSVPVVGRFFNPDPKPSPGSSETVWVTGGMWREKGYLFPVEYGPAFRHVVDLADIANGGFVIDVGQSGWPQTDNYTNGYEDWYAGRQWSVSMNEEQYSQNAQGVMLLMPAN